MTAAAGAAALGASLMAGSAMAAEPVDEITPGLTSVTVFNINDFHGRIDADAEDPAPGLTFACTVEEQKDIAGDGNWIFLSAGDNIGATPFTSGLLADRPTIEYLNALELSASAVGNHEFDRGFTQLTTDVADWADFPYLGANVYERETENPVLQEYEIFTVNGVTIGVIGAVTEQTPTMVNPDGVAGLDFGDPVEAVNRVAAQLSDGDDANGEADVIVAEYHEGAAVDTSLADAMASSTVFTSIVEDTSPEVDVIFNGHTHLGYTFDAQIPGAEEGETRPVIQSYSYAGDTFPATNPLARVILGIDADMNVVEYNATNLPVVDAPTAECEADPQYIAAKDVIDAANVLADELGDQVIGEVAADITRAAEGDRSLESSLGNLVAEAWLDAMQQPGRPGADIGIMNPGGLRADLTYESSGTEADGEVTYREAYEVNPFANTMQTIDITGAQFKTLLEQQWQPEGASRPFLKLGLSYNVRYTYDADAPVGEKITSVWFDGAPMDPTETYRIAAGSFLIAGGDNFTVLRDGENSTDTGLIDSDAFINYLDRNSPVAPSWEKNGVATEADQPVQVSVGGSATFVVSDLDLTSVGAPDNTEFAVYLGEREVGTAVIETVTIDGLPDGTPVRTGRAVVTLTVPADFPVGATVITLVAEESGTTVKLLAEVKAATTGPVVETDIPVGSGSGLGLFAGLVVAAAAGGLVLTRRRRVTEH